MPLLAYNLTTSSVVLDMPTPPPALPASAVAGTRGAAVGVTGELRNLTDAQYATLAVQAVGTVDYEWTVEPEYDTGPLKISRGLGLEESIAEARLDLIEARLQTIDESFRCMIDAASADAEFEVIPAAFARTAAELNAAAAGTVKDRIIVRLKNADGVNHFWAHFDLTIDLAKTTADPDIGPPTIDPATVKLAQGTASFDLIWDTDAGVTKVYAAADSVSATIRTQSNNELLGWSVAAVVSTGTVT